MDDCNYKNFLFYLLKNEIGFFTKWHSSSSKTNLECTKTNQNIVQ